MPPDAFSCAAVPRGIDAVKIADDRETVATRSPSPCDDDGPTSEVMEELKPAKISRVKRIKNVRKAGMFKSFTAGEAGGRGIIATTGSWDEDVVGEDENSSTTGSGVHSIVSSLDDHAGEEKLPRRRVPARKGDRKSGASRLRLKSSGLFSSFTKAKGAVKRMSNNHSSHPVDLSNLIEDEELSIDPNSCHNGCLTEVVRANSKDGLTSLANVDRLLRGGYGDDDDDDDDDNESASGASGGGEGLHVSGWRSHPSLAFSQQSSAISQRSSFTSQTSSSLVLDNELDLGEPRNTNGDGPSTLSSVALLESLGDSPTSGELANVAAVRAREYIEECLRADVRVLDRERWDSIPQYTKADLLIGKHLGKGTFSDAFEVVATVVEEGGTAPALARFREDGTELDARIERLFSGDRGEDLDAEVDALFSRPPAGLRPLGSDAAPQAAAPPPRRRRGRRQTVGDGDAAAARGLGRSICLGTHVGKRGERRTSKVVMAMKCLRPQIRSDAEQFLIGVEDLVHETAMLASLDHPHIVKLRGRAGGCVGSSFQLSDGYFILLDRLKDTLEDRIARWKKVHNKKAPPSLAQVSTACDIADAVSYLHSKNIVFRDLKPANVGFDASDTLKLFDFGFAVGMDEPRPCDDENGDDEEDGLLYDRCGTPRYMAPEVGLQSGYGLPADVYSFGILLWEICSLKRPFGNVKSAKDFERTVFEKGGRPKPCGHWPRQLTDLMEECWSTDPAERPGMPRVKSILAAHARELAAQQKEGGSENNLRKSSVFRRFTG